MIILPLPPALNTMYRRSKWSFYKSDVAKKYDETAGELLSSFTPVEGDIYLEVWCYFPNRKSDVDSRLKSLLDVLQKRLYVNDSQIVDLVVHKRLDKADPRVEVSMVPVTVWYL